MISINYTHIISHYYWIPMLCLSSPIDPAVEKSTCWKRFDSVDSGGSMMVDIKFGKSPNLLMDDIWVNYNDLTALPHWNHGLC